MSVMSTKRLLPPSLRKKTQATVAMIGLRQDSIASLSRSRNKPTKKQSLIKVGSNVTFTYNGKKVGGVVRCLGQTDFSTSILCGIELSEDIGKHNGTVKGKTYFKCPENRGVFVPLKKVTLVTGIALYSNFKPSHRQKSVGQNSKIEDKEELKTRDTTSLPLPLPPPATTTTPTPSATASTTATATLSTTTIAATPSEVETATTEEEDEDEMRITIRSYKTSETPSADPTTSSGWKPRGSPLSVSSERNPSSNSSCDSGIESPTRKVSKDKSGKPAERRSFRSSKSKFGRFAHGKNIVVSSYTTPTPKKPVLFQSFDDEISSDIDVSKIETTKTSPRNPNLETQTFVKRTEPRSDDASFAENIDPEVFEKYVSKGSEGNLNNQETTKTVITAKEDLHKSVHVSSTKTEGSNNICSQTAEDNDDDKSKIPVPRRTSSTKILEKFEQGRLQSKSPSTSVSKSTKIFERLEQDKSSQISSNKSNRDKTTPSQISKRSLKPTAAVTPIGKSTTITMTAKSSPTVAGLSKSKYNSRIAMSADRTSTSVTKTEAVQTKAAKIASKRCSGKDEDPSVIMGNTNASVHSTSKSTDQIPSQGYSQREVSGAIVIERKNSTKNKTKSNNNQNEIISTKDTKIPDKNNKGLQQQVDNLENQLKERANRISELELSLENNNNSIKNERNEFDTIKKELEKDLQARNQTIMLQETKLNIAESHVSKSNQGLEALSLVIKYYLSQVDHLSDALRSSKKTNKNLLSAQATSSADNNQLKADVADLKKKLESEICRCDSLQKELESLNINHEKELSRVRDEYNQEINRIIENNTNEQKKEASKAFDEQQRQIKDITQTHESELQLLKEQHERKLNELNDEHKKLVQEKEQEHLEVVARLKVEGVGSPRLKSPVGTPISPENVPEELKSLHVVLEMKNDELKSIRTKNMELQRKVDKYYELQTKYDALNQKNQSLSEMLKQKSHKERQLSVERESLMEKFEQESRKVSRLSMEKEQLIWRASNPDLTYKSLENLHEEQDDEDLDSPSSLLRSLGSFSNNVTPRGRMSGEAQISKKLKRRSMNF